MTPSQVQFLRLYCCVVAQAAPGAGGLVILGDFAAAMAAQCATTTGRPFAWRRSGAVKRVTRPWEPRNPLAPPLKRRRLELPVAPIIALSPLLLLCPCGAGGSRGAATPGINIDATTRGVIQLVLSRQVSFCSASVECAILALNPELAQRQAAPGTNGGGGDQDHNTIAASASPESRAAHVAALIAGSQAGYVQVCAAALHFAGRLNVHGALLSAMMGHGRLDTLDVSASEAPPSVLPAFLDALMRDLSRRCHAALVSRAAGNHDEFDNSVKTVGSVPTETARGATSEWLWGGGTNLALLVDRVVEWSRTNTRAAPWPAAAFTRGVKPSAVAWLTAIETGGRHRSARLQRILHAFLSLFIAFVVPHWVRAAFHVTYATRAPRLLQLHPLHLWRRRIRVMLQPMPVRLLEGAGIGSSASTEGGGCGDALAVRLGPQCPWLRPLTPVGAWARGAASPQRHTVMFGAVRLLPDGAKLRPITTMRAATGTALGRICTTRRRHRRRGVARDWPDAAPQRGVLRQALECIVAGSLRGDDSARISCRTPEQEYDELLFFARNIHREVAAPTAERPDPAIYFVRADAARCFDLLEQAEVARVVRNAVAESRYYFQPFDAIVPDAAAGGKRGQRVVRAWSRTLTGTEFDAGRVLGIPRGWIVRPAAGTPPHVEGAAMRAVLAQHCRAHVVSLRGRLYVQGRGIVQGSPVASALCDAALAAVDASLVEVLDNFPHATSLLLRRMDDVLILTTCRHAATMVLERIRAGWPHVGFRCNDAKLQHNVPGPSALPTPTFVATAATGDGASDSMSVSACPHVLQSGASASHRPTTAIPWCALLLHIDSGCSSRGELSEPVQVGVDWSRVNLSTLARSVAHRPRAEWSVYVSAVRVVRSLRMRCTAPVFCGRLNPPERVLATLCEFAVATAWAVVEALVLHAAVAPLRPHPRLMFRAAAVTAAALSNHILGHVAAVLRARHSHVGGDLADRPRVVPACVDAAFAAVVVRRRAVLPQSIRLPCLVAAGALYGRSTRRDPNLMNRLAPHVAAAITVIVTTCNN
jgi:hypothetical protein